MKRCSLILRGISLVCLQAGCVDDSSYERDGAPELRASRVTTWQQYNLCEQYRNDFVERQRLQYSPSYK